MIEGVRTLFEKIRSYLKITHMSPIARRYFVKNGFDGSMTTLGIVIGSWLVRVDEPQIIVTAGLAACLAMGVSGLFGAYMTERAERKRDLKILENAMLTDLKNSIHNDASDFVSLYAAVIDGSSPMLTAVISLIPFILTYTGVLGIWDAYIVSVILTLFTLFLLGIYLGRTAKENALWYGIQTVAAGLVIVVIVLAIGNI
jgi:predicted membrane protein (TIGR00267 family)